MNNQSNTFPNQQNSIPIEKEMELTGDSLKQALVEALKPYTAKQIKDNFEGFVPDKFVDGKTIGNKGTGSHLRHNFSEEIINSIDGYFENKIRQAFATKNQPLDTETEATFKEYVHHHLLTYKGFQRKTCDMIIDNLISPLLENKQTRSSGKNSRTAVKRKDNELEPYGTIKCFEPNIDIPDILKIPLSTENIKETSPAITIAEDVLFPVLMHIMFPKCPFQLRKAMVWKQRVTRIINFAVCSTLILKYQNHNQLEQDIKEELKRKKLPPWWCVSCFYNTYKLSNAKEKDHFSSQSPQTDQTDATPSTSHLSLSTLGNRTEEWKTFQETLQTEYIEIHNSLYNKAKSFWNIGTFDKTTKKIWKPKMDGYQDLKMEIDMKRPPAYQDVPEILYKYKRYYPNGIFDEGWADVSKKVVKDQRKDCNTNNHNNTDKTKETTKEKIVKVYILKCKEPNSVNEDSTDIKTLSSTDLTFDMLPVPITDSNGTTTEDTPMANGNDTTTEDTTENENTKLLQMAGKEGVHLFEHLILDKVFGAHILDRSVHLKRFARGR